MAQDKIYTSTVATVHGQLRQEGATRCQLVVVEGPDMGRALLLDEEEKCVGTDQKCALVLHDDRVSREHAAFRWTTEGVSVRDLGSRNDTLYNGSAIKSALIPLGGTLKIGRTFLRILDQPEALQVVPSQSRRFGELVAESLAMREVFA
ncbi:MAG: FHA domain-containing protein, partial [Deltaproteobacteria bacterium]|nr:FHA domain-containing protein [Deltaproteobacteria bacterium]